MDQGSGSGMRVLVTGGAGFIGSHVVDRLVARGHDVVVLDNLDPQVHGADASHPKNLLDHIASGSIEFRRGDVRDADDVRAALADRDAVIHLAAAVGVGQSMYQPHYYTSVNVDGQGVLMEAMTQDVARYRRFVVASSMSIYGEGTYRCAGHGEVHVGRRTDEQLARRQWEHACPQCGRELSVVPTREEKPLDASSIYAISKKTQEEMALCFGAAYALPTVALRLFNVYGSRQALNNPYTGVAAIFMGRLKAGAAPLLFEDGHQSRDLIHVSDVADAIVLSLEAAPEVSGVFNVCSGRATTILEVALRIAELLGVDVDPEIVSQYRSGDIRHCIGDPERAARELGFRASMSVPEGLTELLAWSEVEPASDPGEGEFPELDRRGLLR